MQKALLTAALLFLMCPGLLIAGGQAEIEEEAEALEDGLEAPMLARRVADGELPPVEDRLPDDPFVAAAYHEIGRYGGTVRTSMTNMNWWWHSVWNLGNSRLITTGPEGNLIPHVAAGWDFSPDAKTFTLYLREGLRWSDGEPFTADDIMFWYEDVLLNETLTPSIGSNWAPGGETIVIEKIDDYTVQYEMAVSNPHFVAQLGFFDGDVSYGYMPKHYLSQFHEDYASADELEASKREYGYEHWWQLFQSRAGEIESWDGARPVDAPTLTPYVVVRRDDTVVHKERNPYFWKVDTEGRQLPYFDRVRAELVGDTEVQEAKVVAGELDLYVGTAGNLGLYTRHAESAGIKPYMWTTGHSARASIHPNLVHRDPVLRDLFQDARFRKAMSLALDREEMNDLIWLGLGEPRQSTVVPPSQFYREEFARAYADHDVDEANRLLDDMGLAWDDGGEYRLRPDGERIRFRVQANPEHADWVEAGELVVEYWRDIGLEVVLDVVGAPLFTERIEANEHDVVIWGTEWAEMSHALSIGDWRFVPGSTASWGMVPWVEWYASDGEDGEEPPQWVDELMDLADTWRFEGDEDKRIEAGMRLVELQAENIYYIGTVGMPVRPMILNANMRNVPDELVYTLPTGNAQPANPETWYYDE